MVVEIEPIAAFDTQELAVDAAAIAIVAADDTVVAYAQRGLAAVAAVRADRPDVFHLPRPRLVAVGPAGQRAHGANVDTRAAFVAFQVIADIRRDLADHAAVNNAQRADAHALIADAHAAEAQNASRRIEIHHRRILLFRRVHFLLGVPALARAVAKHHVLQFALA